MVLHLKPVLNVKCLKVRFFLRFNNFLNPPQVYNIKYREFTILYLRDPIFQKPVMILSFSVENYMSFQRVKKLTFQAATIKEHKEIYLAILLKQTILFLKSIGIFGNNNSGKSNLIKAASFMQILFLSSSKESNSSQQIRIQPFLLSTDTQSSPSTFEMVFILDTVKYKYGFSVSKSSVHSEWLFVTEKRKENKLFLRANTDYTFEKKFKEGLRGKFELFAEVTRSNSLFLSVLAQFNSPLCVSISKWFDELIFAHDTAHFNLIDSTASLMKTGDYRTMINEIIKRSDLGIENVEEQLKQNVTDKISFYDFIRSATTDNQDRAYSVMTGHFLYNAEKKPVQKIYFDLLQNESLGTQKFFGILGPILYSLTQKKVIWIDEIDARVHTILLEKIISLFNSNKYNPNGAQLIFTSHNLIIMKEGLRRDQMHIIAKDEIGISTIESLHAKGPKIRSDASFDKDYLLGRYGGIPKLGTQLNIFDS